MGEKMMKDGVKSEMGKRGGFKYGTHELRKIQGKYILPQPLQTVSGFRFQVSGFRFQVSGFRFPASGFSPSA